MKHLVLAILAILLNLNGIAQSSIEGVVVDSLGAPIPYAIVALLSAQDSSVVKGTPTREDGVYALNNMERDTYLLRISATGFDVYYSEGIIIDSASSVHREMVVLRNSRLLNGVTVTAIRPVIEFKNGNTIVNIENSALSKGNSVFDLLPKLPGVSVIDNRVMVQGKAGVIFMIDGRVQQVSNEQLINMLKGMSAESVERIEILRNPPSKYDASGTSGMIHIVTKKNGQKGFSGSVFASTAQGFYNNSSTGITLNYKNENIAMSASVSGADGWFKMDDRHYRLFYLDSGITQMNSANHWKEQQKGINFKMELDWFMDSLTTFGVKVDGAPGGYTSYGTGDNYVVQYNAMGFDHLNTINYVPNTWNFTNYNVNGDRLLDTSGSRISFSADYGRGNEHDRSESENHFYNVVGNEAIAPSISRNRNESSVEVISGKSDYLKQIDSVSYFEAGVKFSTVSTGNDYMFEQRDTSSALFVADPHFSNGYQYAENTSAAYVDYSRSWKKFDFLIGLRGEYTRLKGHDFNSGYNLQRDYFNVFPNLNFAYKPSDDHDWQMSMSRRVDRPAFDDLNPFVYFINPYSYVQGNPFLQPDYGTSLSLTHSYKGIVVNTVSFERVDDIMLRYTFQDDSSKVFYQNIANMNFQNSLGYSLFVQQDLKSWWSLSFSGDLTLLDFKGSVSGVAFRTYGFSYSATAINEFILPRDYDIELLGMYRGPNLYGITRIDPVWMVSVAVKKLFLDRNLSCTIGLENVFNSMKFHTHTQFDNQDWNYYVVADTRRLSLSVSYNFGKVKVEQRGSNSNEEEKQRLDL